MFNRLKFKLTIIQLLLLSAVLLVIFSGIYLLMSTGMKSQSHILLKSIAGNEQIAPPIEDNKLPPLVSNSFFLKVDTSGQYFESSAKSPFSDEDAKALAAIAVGSTQTEGALAFKNYEFSYYKEPKEYGHILVFVEKRYETEVLSRLIFTSVIIGLLSLVLVFFISLYLSNRAIVPIRNSWEKQNAFTADASHELRTPLAVINSNLEIVMENTGESVESQMKWLGNIQGELSRMNKLVDDLLFLARADMAGEEMPVFPFDLSAALLQTVRNFEPIAAKKGLCLSYDIQSDLIISGNEGRIKQLATILLDNAIKYTGAGGNITLTAQPADHHIEITVSDTGEGIPKEHLDKIFERFYRIDKSRSRNHGGTGLGLSIARCIVKEHKGSITVSSTDGKGSEFRILLPGR